MGLQLLFLRLKNIAYKFELLFNQKFKVMKNLMQKSVKAILCLGVVSVSLIACDSDKVDNNIIDLDQLDDQIVELDSTVVDSLIVDDTTDIDMEPVDEDLLKEDLVENE